LYGAEHREMYTGEYWRRAGDKGECKGTIGEISGATDLPAINPRQNY
jgi:hypothetical protein